MQLIGDESIRVLNFDVELVEPVLGKVINIEGDDGVSVPNDRCRQYMTIITSVEVQADVCVTLRG